MTRRITNHYPTPPGVELVDVTSEREAYETFRGKRLKRYNVFKDGVLLGVVEQDKATMERQTPGRRYVDARWESVRWYARHDAMTVSRRNSYYESRGAAIHALLRT